MYLKLLSSFGFIYSVCEGLRERINEEHANSDFFPMSDWSGYPTWFAAAFIANGM